MNDNDVFGFLIFLTIIVLMALAIAEPMVK